MSDDKAQGVALGLDGKGRIGVQVTGGEKGKRLSIPSGFRTKRRVWFWVQSITTWRGWQEARSAKLQGEVSASKGWGFCLFVLMGCSFVWRYSQMSVER